MSAPVVSVVMPVRGVAHLADAVADLLAQDMPDFELIMVDDTASDADCAALRLAARDTRCRILSAGEARGVAALLNLGCSGARASLIARADADDRYHPQRLSRQVAAMGRNPSVVALSCGYDRIAQDGRRLWSHRPETAPPRLRLFAKFGAPLLHPGAMMRKGALDEVGGYDPALWTAQDSDLWVRLSAVGDLGNLPTALVGWREHGASLLARRGAAGRALSLDIAARHLAAYLGERPDGLIPAIRLWRRERLTEAELTLAQNALRIIARHATAHEPRDVARAFCRRIAGAHLAQRRTPGTFVLAGRWITGKCG